MQRMFILQWHMPILQHSHELGFVNPVERPCLYHKINHAPPALRGRKGGKMKTIAEMTHVERIEHELNMKGKINDRVALNKYGIRRLSARIYDLRAKGMDIETVDVIVKDQFGHKCRVAEYRLGDEDAK